MIYFYLNTSPYYLFSLSHFILCSLIWINHIFWYHSMSFLPLLGYIFLTILFKSYLTDYKMNLWFNKAINISTIITFCIIQRSSNTNSIDLAKFCATVSILSFFPYRTVKSHLLHNTDFLRDQGSYLAECPSYRIRLFPPGFIYLVPLSCSLPGNQKWARAKLDLE